MPKLKTQIIKTSIIVYVLSVLIIACSSKQAKHLKIEYYENGNIKSILPYQSDTVLYGEALWFHQNGTLEQKVNFKNGKANGRAYYFYNNGSLKADIFWICDKKQGYAADYFDDTLGLIKNILFYTNDSLTYHKEFNKKGDLIKMEGVKPVVYGY